MSAFNKARRLLGSMPHFRGFLSLLVFSGLIGAGNSCSSQNPKPGQIPFSIFDERPFHFGCVDRPSPLPPGTRGFVTFSPQAPYARTRLETLNLPLDEVPALTIAAEHTNWLQIIGANQDHWGVQFCAEGEGDTIDEANGYLRKVSMRRTGSLLTLSETDARGLTGGKGNLLLTAPASAPLTVHSDAAVEVHDMAMIIDYSGSQGAVELNASWDIDIKITETTFRGNLAANAQRQVNAFFPPGFQTPVEVLVDHPKDFVCRADFCSKMKKDRVNSLYRFTYGSAESASAHIGMRSMNAQVVLDTTP